MGRRPNAACAVCGASVYRRPKELARGRVYCGKTCYGLSCRKPYPCPICGKEILSGNGGQTCSRACANKNRAGSKYRTGNQNNRALKIRSLKVRIMEERGARYERCNYARLPSILNLHHVLPRSKGGTDEPSNLELICPNCHAEIHYGGLG